MKNLLCMISVFMLGGCLFACNQLEPLERTRDCGGVSGGESSLDDCGVCDGDNSCLDCGGVPNGGSLLDDCGVCDGDNSCLDCAGVPNGGSLLDDCGVCDGDNSCLDCAGVPNGGALIDECGVCGGDNRTCSDCAGVPNGGSLIDECGVCGGDNRTCADCMGVPNGTSWVSDCGCVAADNSGDDCDDCAGVPNGDSLLDNCGKCDPSPENDCVPDCAGIMGGDLVYDECGVCDGDNSCLDCDGVPNGGALMDECGVCNGDGSTCGEPESSIALEQQGNDGGVDVTVSCPPGQVAVGYSGQTGAWFDYIHLICATLEADGTLASNQTHSNQLGVSSGGNEQGDKLCPDNAIMVGAHVRAGDSVDYVQGHCAPAECVLNPPNETPCPVETAPGMGNSNGGVDRGVELCPSGYAVTGVTGSDAYYPRRLSWLCTILAVE